MKHTYFTKIKAGVQLTMIFLVTLTSYAQQNSKVFSANSIEKNVTESIYLHVNSGTFVTGEMLFYKIYCLNPIDIKPSAISKVAYVELLDSKKNIIFKHKLFLQNGNAQSDFLIPATLQSGSYKIIAYTNWMQNNSSLNLFEQEIYLINPFEPIPKENMSLENSTSFDTNGTTEDRLQSSSNVTTDKKSYFTREEVQLSFGSKLQKGNYSISVRKSDILPQPNVTDAIAFIANLKKDASQLKSSELLLPELRGEIISGKIEPNTKGNPVQNIPISLSIPGENFVFKIVQTNSKGQFFFVIDTAFDTNKLILQVIGERKNDYKIQLDGKKNIDYAKINLFNNLRINAEIKEALINRSVASQIQSAYFFQKTDSITNLENKNIFDTPDRIYKLDDYTRFPTLKKTITEVLTDIRYSKSQGKYAFHLKDINAKTQLGEPVITLMDGILVPNVSDIFDYNAREIETVSIISKGYIYGGYVSSGIISIKTKNGDFSSDKIDGSFFITENNIVPEKSKKYYTKTYDNATKNGKIPDFRTQLLWIPELDLSKNDTQIKFFTSDETGIYEISVQGFTLEGKPVSLFNTFEVK